MPEKYVTGDNTVKDKNPGGNVESNVTENRILSERQIVQESSSKNNGTKAEEGSKQKRRRRKKKKKIKEKAELKRKAYNESRLREEWEDLIFKR